MFEILTRLFKKNKNRRNGAKRILNWEKIADLYKQGMHVEDIAKKCNCHEQSVYVILRKLNIPKTNNTRKRGMKRIFNWEEIVDLYKQGMHIEDIAKKCNCHNTTVYGILRELNIPRTNNTRKRGMKRIFNWEEIADLYKGGMNAEDIAKRCNCHKQTVYVILRELNIPRRKGRPSKLKDDIVRKCVKDGLMINEIAKKFSCTPSTVYMALKRLNLKIDKNKHRDQKIKKLCKQGYTRNQIAEKCNLSYNAICYILRRLDIKAKRKRKYNHAEIVNLYKENF